ncbi:MAG: site-specific DNA-methyltransferase, partial [Methylococcaceae bacterium]|nr:site-specific DNA-methyltransferase [Methylococcaceae bacterium]
MAYERGAAGLDPEKQGRNRDLDPQLIWRGKDEQDWSELVVHAPPLYIQEKVHPKVLIDDLMRRSEAARPAEPNQIDLFNDFNGLPDDASMTEFYRHDAHWSNRMILGDSLQVMASLAEREGLRGKVQCIYLDPPYGIKFNSNFQWSTTSRDVKDGNAAHITREPEQVKAFRDTWRDGVHSYLTYLRDRLTVARDLLAESGSVFVQIGDENVHRVRGVMDEVFGEQHFVSQIHYTTTSGFTSETLSRAGDYILWYTRRIEAAKYRRLYVGKLNPLEDEKSKYDQIEEPSLIRRLITREERNSLLLLEGLRVFRYGAIDSQDPPPEPTPFEYCGQTYNPPNGRHWTANYPIGMRRLKRANRLVTQGKGLAYARFFDDFNIKPFHNLWYDIGGTVQSRSDPKIYVVQTGTAVVQRCILMTTDPGDLVLDPTCGSGTTAYVAEQWGRRWITMDTSRVALALARARIMG